MAESFGRFLRREQLINGTINLVLNGGFAWWLTSGATLPLWQGHGAMGPDLIITSVLLGYLLALGVAFGMGRKRDKGGAPAVDGQQYPWISRLPGSTAKLAVAVGGLALLVGIVFALGMHALGLDPFPRDAYVALKAVYAGALALWCNYMVIVRVLSQPRRAAL